MVKALIVFGGLLFVAGTFSAPARASALEVTLDRDEIMVAMNPPTVIHATLRNSGTAPIYVTGVKVLLSKGARGDVYNPALLHERLLRLDAGQSWGGPLVVVQPSHRGPLWVKGSIYLTGGSRPDSVDPLATIPLRLMIHDPSRNMDGSYELGTKPACDRVPELCCDLSEDSCFHIADRCVYVAEGYNRQEVCVNNQPQKSYERVADLRVSTDGAHIAYLANSQCQSEGLAVRCKRVVVIDRVEVPGPGIATHLGLSPDGRHYAYIRRDACLLFPGEERCSGASHPVVDNALVDALPAWYPAPN